MASAAERREAGETAAPGAAAPSPLGSVEVLAEYFLENRARLIEVAAWLDRLQRAGDPATIASDFRLVALRQALTQLTRSAERAGSGQADGDCAAAVQRCFSDPTDEPRASAAGLKGASGAWPGLTDPAGGGRR